MNLLQVWTVQAFSFFLVALHFLVNLLFMCALCQQKEGRQRGTWNGKKADNDFYKKIVCRLICFDLWPCHYNYWYFWMLIIKFCLKYSKVDAYEAKNQGLVAENADLRALLRSMQVGHCYLIDVVNFWNVFETNYESNVHFFCPRSMEYPYDLIQDPPSEVAWSCQCKHLHYCLADCWLQTSNLVLNCWMIIATFGLLEVGTMVLLVIVTPVHYIKDGNGTGSFFLYKQWWHYCNICLLPDNCVHKKLAP